MQNQIDTLLTDGTNPMALVCSYAKAVQALKSRGDWPHPRTSLTLDEILSDFHVNAMAQRSGPIGSKPFRQRLRRYVTPVTG